MLVKSTLYQRFQYKLLWSWSYIQNPKLNHKNMLYWINIQGGYHNPSTKEVEAED